MKKTWSILLALSMVFMMSLSAMAEGTSLTTGLPTEKEHKPITVQIDNEPNARPQKGLAKADVVYEIELYNGGYTRYTAVFNDNIPSLLEAVRSTRISNVDLYLDWGGAFVYYGGQNYEGRDVFKYMDTVKIEAQIAAMDYPNFKRDSKRAAPNNVYCNLQDVIKLKEYTAPEKSPLNFSADGYTTQGGDVSEFDIVYRSDSYHPSYTYRPEEGVYYRSYNDKPHVDGDSNEQITCANVIVMRVETSWHNGMSDAPVHKLTGKGNCEYFVGGKHFSGTWSRDSVNDNTQYLDSEGNPVVFKPGKTFIQIAKDRVEINMKSK